MRRSFFTTIFLILCVQSTSFAETAENDIRFVRNTGGTAPYSPLVEAGGFIFLAGALGINPETGKLAEGGIEGESRQAMENIKASLAAENVSMNRIVKCTVMLADIDEWPALNKVYAQFFDGNYPARSAFAVSGLGRNARVEIECIAKR